MSNTIMVEGAEVKVGEKAILFFERNQLIRKMYVVEGLGAKFIGDQFGISAAHVKKIVRFGIKHGLC